MPAGPGAPLLEVQGVSKHFPGVRALHDVDLTLSAGEVLAVIGENGAGKSTLMRILGGIEQPDAGRILLDGREVRIVSARAAMALGIALIHQELDLADNLDAGANIYLGREPRRLGFLDRRRIERGARGVLGQVGADFAPSTLVRELSIGQQQLVEIAKALSLDARILIMDEPTSSLSGRETERLFAVVRELRARGVSVLYISHRLGEVRELADRVLVLRDGERRGELAREEIEHGTMVRMMVGRDVAKVAARASTAGAVALRVEGLVVPAHPEHGIDFEVRQGEIVGLAGLVGAGRSELLRVLFGIDRALRGAMTLGGRAVRIDSPRRAVRAGLALVPEDRKEQALFLEMAVRENVSIAALHRQHPGGLLRRSAERRQCERMIGRLRIATPGPEQRVGLLSGGNQQKVVLARWLLLEPRVLLLDEPTRGIDVGARHEIYGLMRRLADDGVAILFASSEMEEVLAMSDRLLVMHEGRIAGELARDRLDEEAVLQLATGAVGAPR